MTTHIDPYSMENKKLWNHQPDRNWPYSTPIWSKLNWRLDDTACSFEILGALCSMIQTKPNCGLVPVERYAPVLPLMGWCFWTPKKMKVKHDHHRPPVQNVQYELFITYLKSQELLKPPTNWLCTKQKPQNCTCNWVIALLIWQVGVGAHVPLASC